jgi:AraC-like DNA-binding protein
MSRNSLVNSQQHLSLPERRVINFVEDGIPDVVSLGRYEYHCVKPGLSTHRHIDAIEICYLERGCQIYRLHDREYRLVGGDVLVVPPGEPHDTGGRLEDCGVLYWLILRIPSEFSSLLSLSPEDSCVISNRLLNVPKLHFAGRPILKQIFNRLFDLHDLQTDALKPLVIRHQLLCCILELLHCAYNEQHRQPSKNIQRAVDKIRRFPEHEFSLADLAEEAGLSLSRFKVKFKSETGIAPHEFILRTKIEAAKVSLAQGELSVTDIAMELGFSSSQYFATVFRRFTQETPIEYRGRHCLSLAKVAC